MFGGAWLSWPWFAFNAFAIGSPTRFRELALAIGGFAGSAAISMGLLTAVQQGALSGSAVRYAVIVLTVWKLVVSYVLYGWQSRSFHLYEHFGGTVRSGFALAMVAGFVLRNPILKAFPGDLWTLVMG